MFDARVVKISHSMKLLKNEITLLEGIISPLKISKKTRTLSHKRNLESQSDIEDIQSTSQELPKKYKKLLKTDDKLKKGAAGQNIPPLSPVIENEGDHSSNDEDIIIIPEKNAEDNISSNNKIHRDNEIIKNKLSELCEEMKNIKRSQAAFIQIQNDRANHRGDDNEQIEIGHQGSNVFVSRRQWETADSRETFQRMGISLTQALFPKEILLASNLRGGASKINKDAPLRPGLDSNIIGVIEEAVKNKFPRDFKRGLFGMAINNMLTEMRRKNPIVIEPEVDQEVNQEVDQEVDQEFE
ncbi:uncharacterized protein LOC130674845 isoform X2 [Microplitis mediator]|nr:uncharacterized protein LOC130674845 isoform X2 [Microplitis mediator]